MTYTSGNGHTPPGWYPDNRGTMRWYDGSAFTEHTQNAPSNFTSPTAPPGSAGKGPWYTQKLVWAVAAVVVLAGLGAAVGDDESGDTLVADDANASQPAAEESVNDATPTESAPASESAEPESETPEPESPEPEPAEPKAVKVQAGQMLDEFDGNEAAADAKYVGKVVEVTGNVAKVDTEFFDNDRYVIRLDNGDDFAFLSVNCNDVSADVAAKVQSDSDVTVRGEFDDGGDLGVELKDCTVV